MIDDISLQDPNYLPVSIVVEAHIRELVRRFGMDFTKKHVALPCSEHGLVCQQALRIVRAIENEMEEEIAAPTASQPDSTSTSPSITVQS